MEIPFVTDEMAEEDLVAPPGILVVKVCTPVSVFSGGVLLLLFDTKHSGDAVGR